VLKEIAKNEAKAAAMRPEQFVDTTRSTRSPARASSSSSARRIRAAWGGMESIGQPKLDVRGVSLELYNERRAVAPVLHDIDLRCARASSSPSSGRRAAASRPS